MVAQESGKLGAEKTLCEDIRYLSAHVGLAEQAHPGQDVVVYGIIGKKWKAVETL